MKKNLLSASAGSIEVGRENEGPILFVASNGGHLEQLKRLANANWPGRESHWITFDSPQARSLMEGRSHSFIAEISQRDWQASLRAIPYFVRLMKETRFSLVVSTGAAIAVPAFIGARIMRAPTLYIESVSRVDGPSLTGRIVSRSRLAKSTWTQHPSWATGRWKATTSVLDTYSVAKRSNPVNEPRLFVTLGTLRKYRFDALVDGVMSSGLANNDTVWQLGVTLREDLPGEVNDFISSDSFDQKALGADLVVTHAGVGSVLRLLELGIFPVLVIRRRARGEHIDDHQAQISQLLKSKGLAIVQEADSISMSALKEAAQYEIR